MGPFGVGTATGELGLTLTHHTPSLGVCHHHTPYSILCDTSQGWHPNGHFVPGLPRGSPEIPPSGTPATLKPYNFRSRAQIDLPSEAKLYVSSRPFDRYVARFLQLSISGQFLTFSGRESKLADSREFDSRAFFWP